MYAWGNNSVRHFYMPGDDFISSPEKVDFFNDKHVKVIAGADKKCALLFKDGSVHLYDASTQKVQTNSFDSCKVTSLETLNIVDVAAGGGHIFVINEKGRVYGWGLNEDGQLGWKDTASSVPVPKLLKSLTSVKICQVSCGKSHTIMLSENSLVYTMGENKFGQLGIGQVNSQVYQPMLITTLGGLPISSVVAGGWHSFVVTISGKVFCWGKNNFGQLGLGNIDNRYTPTALKLLKSYVVLYISAGDNHSAALTIDGGVFTFGASSEGQLGHGKVGDFVVNPRQVMELMGSVVTQVACGKYHTLAYVPSSGQVYSCGNYRQFSIENNPAKLDYPILVKGPWQKTYMNFDPSAPNAGLYMQEVFAYGDQSFALVSKDSSQIRDFRRIPTHRRILCLTDDICNKVEANHITEDLIKSLDTILRSQSCLNASFLDSNHSRTTTKYPGVNLMQAKLQWRKLCNSKHNAIKNCVLVALSVHVIPRLPSNPPDVEALRLFITLPECQYFQNQEHFFQLLVPFTARLTSLTPNPSVILNNWHRRLEPSDFLMRVNICKECIVYILQKQMHSGEARNKLTSLLKFLKTLNAVNDQDNQPIISFKKFYIHDLHKLIPLEADYNQWTRGPESAFGFCHFPFVFNTIAKTQLLQLDSKYQMIVAYEQAQGQNVATLLGLQSNYQAPTNEIVVHRDKLVHDALAGIATMTDLKKPFIVKFVGEEGQDAGGVRKEFFMLILREVVDPKYGMFRHYEDSRLLWFADYDLETGNMYHLIGVLCGLAIYNNTIIDLNFPLALYKKVLGVNPTLSDLKELDPSMGNGLQMLLDFDEEVSNSSIADTFCLSFTASKELFGEVTTVDLRPNGSNEDVTAENRKEYVEAYIQYVFNESVKEPFREFNDGFHKVCGGKVLQLFRPEELMEMVVGNQNYNWEELEKWTDYKGEYYRQHTVIDNFWQVFHSFSLDEKKQFLLFLTGCNKVPVNGVKMVIQSVSCGDRYLPVAHTCFNLLDLPKYSSKNLLETKLRLAMDNPHGFHLA